MALQLGMNKCEQMFVHSQVLEFAKVRRGHFQLLKQRNEVFAELVLPEDFPERQWPQSQAL